MKTKVLCFMYLTNCQLPCHFTLLKLLSKYVISKVVPYCEYRKVSLWGVPRKYMKRKDINMEKENEDLTSDEEADQKGRNWFRKHYKSRRNTKREKENIATSSMYHSHPSFTTSIP